MADGKRVLAVLWWLARASTAVPLACAGVSPSGESFADAEAREYSSEQLLGVEPASDGIECGLAGAQLFGCQFTAAADQALPRKLQVMPG